ncbi:hypothetical protein BFG07_06550 [Kosakonia cowanii]|nr:hypothetical protein BFG07_06550 [Kosakonia cowanii]
MPLRSRYFGLETIFKVQKNSAYPMELIMKSTTANTSNDRQKESDKNNETDKNKPKQDKK